MRGPLPPEKGKRLVVISPAPWNEPCKASQTPFLRPRPGISPPGVPMAPRNSIAPGPGGPFRPRPYWLILPPPIHGPPPGGVVNQRRGRMIQGGPGAGVHGAGWLLPGESMSPGGRSMMSRGGGIVPGAAPMGAGLLPSTGAAGAGKMGGRFHARNGGRRYGLTRPAHA